MNIKTIVFATALTFLTAPIASQAETTYVDAIKGAAWHGASTETAKYGSPYGVAPSLGKPASSYHREQIQPQEISHGGNAVGRMAVLTVGVLTGFIGNLFFAEDALAIKNYLSSVRGTQLVGVVVQDVTDVANKAITAEPDVLKKFPNKDHLPKQYTVDFGSGNMLPVPLGWDLSVNPGDVVSVTVPETVSRLYLRTADLKEDLPLIVALRCSDGDSDCIHAPENEPGIERHGIEKPVARN